MANTREDVAVPKAVWTDLYAATGITVGTAVTVTNKGSSPVNLCISASTPSSTTKGFPLYVGAVGSDADIPTGASGLWAFCTNGNTIVLVQE